MHEQCLASSGKSLQASFLHNTLMLTVAAMDPVTVIGLGIGIIPLIISALENYKRTFQPLIIFSRDCRKEVEKFQLALSVQKAAFINTCQLLLRLVSVHQNEVPQMFQDIHHPLWLNHNLRENLHTRLGDSLRVCEATLFLVQKMLDEVIQNYSELDILLEQRNVSL